MEITKKDTNKLIQDLMSNMYQYLTNTLEVQEEKDKELPELVTESLIESIAKVRPYPNIISSMLLVSYSTTYQRLDNFKVEATVEASVRSALTTEPYTSTILVNMPIVIESVNNKLLVTDYTKIITTISEEDNLDEIMEEDIPMVTNFTNYLLENKPDLDNLYYAYRGRPKEDPLDKEIDKPLGVDMYTVIYWLMKKEGIPNDLDYPLTSEDFLSYEGLYEVTPKGHKYKYYLDELTKGDFIFFDDNDSTVGIYTGSDQFITITGKMPFDKSKGLTIETLDSYWWERFNGRIRRFKEEDKVLWEMT